MPLGLERVSAIRAYFACVGIMNHGISLCQKKSHNGLSFLVPSNQLLNKINTI